MEGEQAQPTNTSGGQQKNNTKAIVALVLGILGLICCGFLTGIPAIFVGKSELNAIDAGQSDPSNRGLAKAGFILGIVSTILYCIISIIYAIIFAIAAMQGGAF